MTERDIILRHAGTVLVGQLAVMAYGVTDTMVAGRFSSEALAALSVGAAVYISVFVALMGVLQAQLPVWAELRGAGRGAEVGRSVRQALYLCGFTIVVGLVVLLFPGPLLRLTDVPLALRDEVQGYLAVLALTLPGGLLFRMYSTLNQALGKPKLITWLQVGSLIAKVPLSLWFAFGGWGVPAMGVVGCAWATLVVTYGMLAVGLWLLRTSSLYRPYDIWRPMERPDWKAIAGFFRLGVPTGLSIMVEVTSFTLMALFIARMGTVASASHQIASNLTAVLYMTPLSIAIATSARVSYWLGAGEDGKARLAIRWGFKLVLLASLAYALVVAAAHQAIAALYAGHNPQVVATAGGLLLWVAGYHVADAVQALCAFVLRCYRVATATLVVYSVMLWGVGLGGGYWLAYIGSDRLPAWNTPTALWAAGAIALAFTAAAFTLMLWLAVTRAKPPALQPA